MYDEPCRRASCFDDFSILDVLGGNQWLPFNRTLVTILAGYSDYICIVCLLYFKNNYNFSKYIHLLKLLLKGI